MAPFNHEENNWGVYDERRMPKSSSNKGVVVSMTAIPARNCVDANDRLTRLCEISVVDNSTAPAIMLSWPSEPATSVIGVPEFEPAVNPFPPSLTRPVGLGNWATAIWPKSRVTPSLN